MYPRNNANPPTIDMGEILLKSDGTQQTTGVSARVKIGTGAWGAAANSPVCDTTSGIWTYTPSQAETNAEFFIVALYKADCTSISKTIITSQSVTSGQVRLEGVTHTGAVIPTVTTTGTATAVTTVNGLAANVITSASIASNAITDAKIQDNAITAAKIANNAIDAATFAADVDAEARGWLGLAAANLDTQLGDIPTNAEFNARSLPSADYFVVGDYTTPPTAGAIADAVWDELTSDIRVVGGYGERVAGNLNAQVSTRASQTSVDDIPTNSEFNARTLASADYATAANVATVAGYLDTEIAAILEDTGTTIPAQISALNNISTTQVLAQCTAALETAITELSGVPSATPTTKQALMLLYMALRNRTTTTASAQTIQNDAGSTIATATLSDDGTTMTKGEFA